MSAKLSHRFRTRGQPMCPVSSLDICGVSGLPSSDGPSVGYQSWSLREEIWGAGEGTPRRCKV